MSQNQAHEKKRTVFVITEQFDHRANSTGYYWHSVVRHLAKRFHVTLVCPAVAAVGVECADSITVYPISIDPRRPRSLVVRVAYQLAMIVWMSLVVARRARGGDVVFTGTNPALLLFPMSLLRRILRFKWVLLVHDVFPENLVPMAIARPEALWFRSLVKLANWSYSQASRLIVIGRDMQEVVRRKSRLYHEVVFVPNWVDALPALIPRAESELLAQLGWKESCVFLFFGNMGRAQGIDLLLRAIAKVKDEHAKFLFVGDGHFAGAVQEFCAGEGSGRARYLGQVPFAEISTIFAACDVALVTLAPGMYGLGVPSKAYFALGANKPILVCGDPDSELDQTLRERKLGWWCDASDPDGTARVIEVASRADMSQFGERPRRFIAEERTATGALLAIERYIFGAGNSRDDLPSLLPKGDPHSD